MFIDYNLYFNDVILGFFVGLGSALSNYFINKNLITHIEKLKNKGGG